MRRARQASTILADLVGATGPTVVMGDFNSLYFEGPMKLFTGRGYVNLTELLPEV